MEDFNTLEGDIKASLVSTVRSANSLGNEDLTFHRSLDTSVDASIGKQNARLLGLAERLVGAAAANTELVRPPRLRDLESVEGNWTAVVDIVDSLLERADTALDEFTGAVKRLSPGAEQATPSKVAPKYSRITAALKNQELDKPQLLFEHVPRNDEPIPFKPLLQSKPHASVPLETAPIARDADTQEGYPHPYQLEIEQYRYPASVYTQSEPIMYSPFESTSATLVDTEETLAEMLNELKQAKEIAIDLEHHDNRSFIGIVCLMQISTRDKDWIVDTLKPWRRKLQCLNEVFADPNIVKVLHGAFMDVVWLQRDLGLYLVGLFDTHYAARALGYTGGSLAFLLKKFINFDAQKQYQLADWRVRPLPQELFDYARSDTHFLLYIFDCMRNELIQRSNFSNPNHEGDKIWDVLSNSSECALQRYEHPVYDTELGQGTGGWYKLISRSPVALTKEQFSVFRAVHKWRDDVARQQDDSIHYIMPNHNLFSIAKAMPTTKAALLGVVQSTTQTVRLRAEELVGVVIRAKEAGKDGPELFEILNKVDPHPVRKPLAASEPAPQAVVAPVPAPKATPLINSTSSNLPLRASTSAFWGSAFESSAWEQKRNHATMSGVALSVPLPPLSAQVFADPSEAEHAEQETQTILEPIPAPTKEEDDDVFILKEMGGKKRRRVDPLEQLDAMAANTDEVVIEDEEAELKAARKAAKKAAKRAAKQPATDNVEAEENDAAFDYASAPSILNPPRESKESAKERKKREKQLNPYSKAMDAPKGLPRVQKEQAGRSMTYKS